MPGIELRDIRNFACRGVNLHVHPGEFLVLLGPNGAGKTTLLNVVAGLIEYQGAVFFDGLAANELPARERNVGYVFQDLVLFPHLNVVSNIAYGLHASGWPESRVEKRVAALLELLRIPHLASRYPAKLSGGEKQRVALARALAAHPHILLLDEPFNSLDVRTGSYLRAELKQLQQDLGMTTLFVTHDLAEAEDIADRVAIVQEGQIEQIGRLDEILFFPRSAKVAEYVGTPNILECQHTRILGHGLAEVRCGGLDIIVSHNGSSPRKIAILPRDITISPHRPATEVNAFEGSISEINILPGSVRTVIESGKCRFEAELTKQMFETMRPALGSKIFMVLSMMKIKTCDDTINVATEMGLR